MSHHSRSPQLTTRRLAAIVGLFILAIVLICLIYIGVERGAGLAHLDVPIQEWMTANRTPLLTTNMHVVTTVLGPKVLAGIAVLIAIIWIWRKKEYWRPILFASSFIGAFAISTYMKVTLERGRPPALDMIPPLETGFSFPSNHTFGIAVFILLLGYMCYSRQPSGRILTIWIGSFIAGTSLMALSRVYLGYHWFTDVMASIALSLVILAIVMLADMYRAWDQENTSTKVL
jgi:undecaprenyl-diphosphatase